MKNRLDRLRAVLNEAEAALQAGATALDRAQRYATAKQEALHALEATAGTALRKQASRMAENIAAGGEPTTDAFNAEGEQALARARHEHKVATEAASALTKSLAERRAEVTTAEGAIVAEVDAILNREREAIAWEVITLATQLEEAMIKLRRKVPDGLYATPEEMAARPALVARALAVRMRHREADDLNIPVNKLQDLQATADPILSAGFDRPAWNARRARMIAGDPSAQESAAA
jgi:ribosome-binding protein aMBF1 (putative translation factor)